MIPISKTKTLQQIKVIKHDGHFLSAVPSCRVQFTFLMAARGIKTIKESFYMARLSGKKKSY